LKENRFKKTLVAIDGSPQSMKAAEFAIDIAQRYNSVLTALHVSYSKSGFAYTSEMNGLITPSTLNDLSNKAKREAGKWFDEIIQKSKIRNIQVKTDAVFTAISVVEAIIRYSEEENIDLIVIGSKGHSGLKKLILGSVASGIVTYSHCPVMIIK
jgi:nucleotide-binding universal stress UspA family protein